MPMPHFDANGIRTPEILAGSQKPELGFMLLLKVPNI